eukprot:6198115-Pleurochrysis_carterae.AAC.2
MDDWTRPTQKSATFRFVHDVNRVYALGSADSVSNVLALRDEVYAAKSKAKVSKEQHRQGKGQVVTMLLSVPRVYFLTCLIHDTEAFWRATMACDLRLLDWKLIIVHDLLVGL